MSNKKNKKVRAALIMHDMKTWMLAEMLGCSESTLSRKFRHEWLTETQDAVVDLISGKRTDGDKVAELLDIKRRKLYHGAIPPSQEENYVEKTMSRVEWVEKRREEERSWR